MFSRQSKADSNRHAWQMFNRVDFNKMYRVGQIKRRYLAFLLLAIQWYFAHTNYLNQLEGCIDDERRFKTAKR